MSKNIKVFDTTLRDGEQAPGCSMSLQEKIEVAKQLEALNVDIIEAGFAASSPEDFKSVCKIASAVKNCSVASLARCTRPDIDAAYSALKSAVSPRIHVFIATSPLHLQYKLKMSKAQVLERTEEMVGYAKSLCGDIEFSAEDATRSEPEFLAEVVRTAIAAGASVINIPDTVGYTSPSEMRSIIEKLRADVPECDGIELSVHCHNDLGLATANTLAGVLGGACQVECTLGGLGERAGNAPLEEVIMAIKTRADIYPLGTRVETSQIYNACKTVFGVIGRAIPFNKPIVGTNAFAHESGIHQHGVLANRKTYEIMLPETIGIPGNQIVLGKHSGRHAFDEKLASMGIMLSQENAERCFSDFKKLCGSKKDVTERDIEAIARGVSPEVTSDMYVLRSFRVHTGNTEVSTAVISLEKDGEIKEDVALGNGPVDASYKAIDKIVMPPKFVLENYFIQSVSAGMDTLGEVVTIIRYNDKTFSAKGISTDIIEASIVSYIRTLNKLMEHCKSEESNT